MSTPAATAAPRPARSTHAAPRALSNWLLAVAALVMLMVVVGGITRLTESGLSITEWKPVSGAIPPLTDAQWQAEFDAYKRIPEYQLINKGMSLAQFKGIFFWEYLHRLIGRVIGLAFALPLAWFWIRRQIPAGYPPRLLALLALGGLQGAIGWWMVKSGLSVRTDVSHIRLAIHLLTALFTMGGLIWTALDLRALDRDATARSARLGPVPALLLLVVMVQLLYGALMAGLNAGLIANDWPLMNGRIFPTEALRQPLGSAMINDPSLVHFIHRWWAWVTVAALVVLARLARGSGSRRASVAIHSTFGVQILIGIGVVMMGVPIWLAAIHQFVGALVLAAAVWGAHVAGRRA